MTIKDLQELTYLDQLIDMEREKLEALREQLGLKSPAITDMPKAPGARDKIGDIVPGIVDEFRKIQADLRELEDKRGQLGDFIRKLPNVRVRCIMTLRYIDHLSWAEVAARIGGRETEDSVRKTASRYLEARSKGEEA